MDNVKITIRDAFEGRVNSIIARFASRFGPLSPWVEARLKRVLDRWWVRFRDRATGRAKRYATQTAEALGQEPQEDQSLEDLKSKDEKWFEEVWSDTEQLLILRQQNCQKSAIIELRGCLLEQEASGASADDAINACEAIMNAIPKNDAGGSVTMTGETIYVGAVANEVTITYPSGGGGVTGRIFYQLYDNVSLCTITTTTDVVGEYDLETCTMGGKATLEILYDGLTCVSVCGPTENSPAPCPVKVTGTTVWEATLDGGVLSGAIGDESCEPHCFGFRAPGYGVAP